jgi:hypothetical protein
LEVQPRQAKKAECSSKGDKIYFGNHFGRRLKKGITRATKNG